MTDSEQREEERRMARILIIDDQPDILDVMKTLLEISGHEISVACEGREALDKHAVDPVDIVITDLHMPGLNGVDTIREFRERHADVKIIAISGADTYMVETNLESSRINGADRTFIKPFDTAELNEAIRDLVG